MALKEKIQEEIAKHLAIGLLALVGFALAAIWALPDVWKPTKLIAWLDGYATGQNLLQLLLVVIGLIAWINLDKGYDSIHNITTNNQPHAVVQPSTQAITQKKTTYNWTYAYNASGASSVRPHAPTHTGERTYTYDANGNQTGWTHDQNGTRRTITWNEENRAETIADNGHVKTYKYDALPSRSDYAITAVDPEILAEIINDSNGLQR